MLAKNKYDSLVVYLYSTGREHLLPYDFRKQIPYTTIASWRKTDYGAYIGHEYREHFEQAFENAELSYRYTQLRKGSRAIARSWYLLMDVVLPVIKKAGHDKAFQKKILQAIDHMQGYIGLERALRLVGISKTLYQQWILESRFSCSDSYTALCAKRHPHQLELKEVQKIKRMLTSSEYDHWPIMSIASLGLRKGDLVASLYTWYKYARLLGISKKPTKKEHKTIGLQAKCPNEYLHVDTTYYPLASGKKVCITFVMDNFSKMILGFHVAERLSFDVVKKALANALKVIARHPEQKRMKMVVDGGKENNNKNIQDFINQLSGHKIKKIRALKDIRFSNSPVEAVHRTIKGRYLRNRKFMTTKELVRYLKWAVNDYNEVRPHYKHKPMTPFEVYFNKPLKFDIRERIQNNRKRRILNNKCVSCNQCGVCKHKSVKPGSKD